MVGFFKRKKRSRKTIEEITKPIEEARVEATYCSLPEVLADIDIDELIAKQGFKSEYTIVSTKLGYNLINDYWCVSELGRKIVKDLEEARKVGEKAFEALILLYSFSIYGICADEPDYYNDPLCEQVRTAVNLIHNFALSPDETTYSPSVKNLIRLTRKLMKIKKQAKHDVKIFKKLNALYREVMEKANR